MRLLHLASLPVFLATGALVSALHSVPADSLEWSPARGQTHRAELITKHFLTTESMVFDKGGQETISQRVFDLRVTQTLRTSDQLLVVGEGRPLKFRRYYDEVRLSVLSETSGGGKLTRDRRIEARGGAGGSSVVFTWVPEDEVYGRYFDGREGIEESLPALAEDLGLRCLLPPEPVDVGATWKLPPGVLRDVISPGGNLNFDLSEASDPNVARTIRLGTGGYLCDVFGDEEKGEVTATWTGTEEVDGRRLATIALKFDVVVSRDLAILANHARTKEEIRARTQVASAPITLELKGTGIVRWDLDAGHLYDTQKLIADEKITSKLVFDVGTDDPEKQLGQTLVMTGSVTQESRITVDE